MDKKIETGYFIHFMEGHIVHGQYKCDTELGSGAVWLEFDPAWNGISKTSFYLSYNRRWLINQFLLNNKEFFQEIVDKNVKWYRP